MAKAATGAAGPVNENCKTVPIPLMGMIEIAPEPAKAPVRYGAVKSVNRPAANVAAASSKFIVQLTTSETRMIVEAETEPRQLRIGD